MKALSKIDSLNVLARILKIPLEQNYNSFPHYSVNDRHLFHAIKIESAFKSDEVDKPNENCFMKCLYRKIYCYLFKLFGSKIK